MEDECKKQLAFLSVLLELEPFLALQGYQWESCRFSLGPLFHTHTHPHTFPFWGLPSVFARPCTCAVGRRGWILARRSCSTMSKWQRPIQRAGARDGGSGWIPRPGVSPCRSSCQWVHVIRFWFKNESQEEQASHRRKPSFFAPMYWSIPSAVDTAMLAVIYTANEIIFICHKTREWRHCDTCQTNQPNGSDLQSCSRFCGSEKSFAKQKGSTPVAIYHLHVGGNKQICSSWAIGGTPRQHFVCNGAITRASWNKWKLGEGLLRERVCLQNWSPEDPYTVLGLSLSLKHSHDHIFVAFVIFHFSLGSVLKVQELEAAARPWKEFRSLSLDLVTWEPIQCGSLPHERKLTSWALPT